MSWAMLSPALLAQAKNLARRLALNESSNEAAPSFKRVALFVREAVFLINADNAGERTGDVVQTFLDHRQINAEPRHAACACSAKIVQAPRRYVCGQQRIEAAFVFAVSACRRATIRREDEGRIRDTRHALENGNCGAA